MLETDKATDNIDLYEYKNTLDQYKKVQENLSAKIIEAENGYIKVHITTQKDDVINNNGVLYDGFILSAAAFSTLIVVNQPNTLITKSSNDLLAPAKKGDTIIFEAKTQANDLRKKDTEVIGTINDVKVYQGHFTTLTMESEIN